MKTFMPRYFEVDIDRIDRITRILVFSLSRRKGEDPPAA